MDQQEVQSNPQLSKKVTKNITESYLRKQIRKFIAKHDYFQGKKKTEFFPSNLDEQRVDKGFKGFITKLFTSKQPLFVSPYTTIDCSTKSGMYLFHTLMGRDNITPKKRLIALLEGVPITVYVVKHAENHVEIHIGTWFNDMFIGVFTETELTNKQYEALG